MDWVGRPEAHFECMGTALPLAIERKPGPAFRLAFGGGFARGMAHVGVLRVFEKH